MGRGLIEESGHEVAFQYIPASFRVLHETCHIEDSAHQLMIELLRFDDIFERESMDGGGGGRDGDGERDGDGDGDGSTVKSRQYALAAPLRATRSTPR